MLGSTRRWLVPLLALLGGCSGSNPVGADSGAPTADTDDPDAVTTVDVPATGDVPTTICSLRAPTGGPTGWACDVDTAQPGATLCRAFGAGGDLEVCTRGTDCQAGFTCVDHVVPSGAVPFCLKLCVTDDDCAGLPDNPTCRTDRVTWTVGRTIWSVCG